MPSPLSRRQAAIAQVVELGVPAKHAVDVVLDVLATPDAHMLAGGLDELNLALGKEQHPQGAALRRDLARVIWNTMLDRAR